MILWDASALAKRFTPEIGSDAVDAIFDTVRESQMVITLSGFAECYSILLRKCRRKEISGDTLSTGLDYLDAQILRHPDFNVIHIEARHVLDGVQLMERHSINSSDSSILASFLEFQRSLSKTQACLLVAADQHLLRAARIEGMTVINPEILTPADLADMLKLP